VIAALRQGARPWLRREAWTLDRLRALAASARRRPRRAAACAAGLAALAALPLLLLNGGDAGGVPTAEVRQGPFRVSIVERGTLQALRSVTYASGIASNQAKIVAMVPEGRMVQKGDLLILFDSAPFEEEIRRSQAALAQAEAELEKARQDSKLQVIQNQEEMAAARQKVAKSDLELRDTLEGKGKLHEEEAALAVTGAERELQKSMTALEDLKPMLQEGFITRQELERAEQQVDKAREDLALARRRRDALVSFGRPLEMSQARADALLTKESLRQLTSAASYRLEQRRAAVAAAESRVQEASGKLALAREQLGKTEVRADVPGIVVHREVFFGSERRKPQVGDQVWANQPLLILPDVSRMVVETSVRETDVHKVERKQRVAVRVQAYPDLKLTGAVSLVGTLAQEEKERRGTKFFAVTVEVNETEPRLRPGMTARVEIEVEERAHALSVPIDAVFARNGGHVCYVVERGRLHPRDVALGPSSADDVVIESGLAPGERVALRDPNAAPSDFSGGAASQ